MNLDDSPSFKRLDPQNMLGEIDQLPDQLRSAWELGQRLTVPEAKGITGMVIAGMGGSAIGADLLAAYAAPGCRVPLVVHRDYGLPGWARGPQTLFIACSHSGNTEETLDSFEAALKNKCRVMAVTTGGKLSQKAAEKGIPLWQFKHSGQPRAAVGFSFGLLLAALFRMGLVGEPAKELEQAVAAMQAQQGSLRASVETAQNLAKRMAGQLVGRWVNVFGSGALAVVARRWKCQINEIAKAGAGFEALPEADHNTLAGTLNPEGTLSRTVALFLRAPSDHPRNRLRLDLTRQGFIHAGLNTDCYDAQGGSRLAHIWTALSLGDYLAYYLAMAYEVDPTPVLALEGFKAAMQAER